MELPLPELPPLSSLPQLEGMFSLLIIFVLHPSCLSADINTDAPSKKSAPPSQYQYATPSLFSVLVSRSCLSLHLLSLFIILLIPFYYPTDSFFISIVFYTFILLSPTLSISSCSFLSSYIHLQLFFSSYIHLLFITANVFFYPPLIIHFKCRLIGFFFLMLSCLFCFVSSYRNLILFFLFQFIIFSILFYPISYPIMTHKI